MAVSIALNILVIKPTGSICVRAGNNGVAWQWRRQYSCNIQLYLGGMLLSAYQLRSDILSIRDASRRMVRYLGFMRPTVAGTDLSPSAVHAIIEIGHSGELTANRLGQILILEKSSVSRLLGRLIARGLVKEAASDWDGRSKILTLTARGFDLLADIDHFANVSVGKAVRFLSASSRAEVVGGLKCYAEALELVHRGVPTEQPEDVSIIEGFKPGAIGRIAEMHGRYYAREWGFGPIFEARVAKALAAFVPRLDRPGNQMWLAIVDGEIKGSIAVDGEDLGDNKAHLRWVIVDDDLRGSGMGRRLLAEAVAFCDRQGFDEIHLWTFRGLDAARKLYETFGFALTEEWTGDQWGKTLPEQRFIRMRMSNE